MHGAVGSVGMWIDLTVADASVTGQLEPPPEAAYTTEQIYEANAASPPDETPELPDSIRSDRHTQTAILHRPWLSVWRQYLHRQSSGL